MLKSNEKEIISLVKNDFIPLEENKEGELKGGFGSVISQTGGPTLLYANNCRCDNNRNNCACPNECWVPDDIGNNCKCGTTTSIPPTPTKGETTTTMFMETGFTF